MHWGNGTSTDTIRIPWSFGFIAGSALSYKLNKAIINLSASNKVVASEL